MLGQNVNAYNFSANKKSYKLSSLIRELNKIDKLKRIRFTTSHPNDMSDDLINCYKDCEKLMPSLHLPIQSGSDKILKLMNRKHNKKYYLSVIEKLKKINQNINISSDFIVGYPGETEEDFNETIQIVKSVGFVNSFSFIFSPRPGTPAAEKKLNNLQEKKKKLIELQNILESLQLKNNEKLIDKYCEILVENKLDDKNKYFGRTKYMNSVIFESDKCKPGDIVDVKISSVNQNNLFGYQKLDKVKAA